VNRSPAYPDRRILFTIGLALLIAGIVICFAVTPDGKDGDDFASLYAMGSGILAGENAYARTDVPLMLYPPATGFALVPFALLPYAIAKPAFFLVMVTALVLGLRALIRLVAPGKGPHVWMGLSGIILMSSAMRWGMMLLQMAPLLLGLLCVFIVALHGGKTRWAVALATLAAVMKVTLALPFFGLLVLQRRFVAVVVGGASWIALNVLGFLRLGPESFATYRLNVGGLKSLDNAINVNMPDPWQAVSLPRLDLTYLFYGLTGNLALSQISTYLVSGVAGIMILREIVLTRDFRDLAATTRFLVPMVCLGSLAVYHHHYDLCLFFAPALLLLFSRQYWHPRWAMALLVPLVLVILLQPVGKSQAVLGMLSPVWGPGLAKLTFVVALIMALVGSLAMLREHRLSGR
jgi:hypothetical protein